MNTLPLSITQDEEGECWNRIGVRGDRSCPELNKVVHCHNCDIFGAAGRRFLDAPSPSGYLKEWTQRLALPLEESAADLQGVLIFRLQKEWLALSVQVLVEVTTARPVHRIPHRGGLLAGLVNIRGELNLCAHLDQVLGIVSPEGEDASEPEGEARRTLAVRERLVVTQRDGERWVFRVDEVDQVHRFSFRQLTAVPPTVARAATRLTRGIFLHQDRTIGLLDEERLFQALRGRSR
jgi:chemotaxis-related protein WspD